MVTLEQINDKVREIALEDPDFIYPKRLDKLDPPCSYGTAAGKTNRVSCVFGRAFFALGVTISSDGGTISEVILREGIPHYEEKDLIWAGVVQSAQDMGTTLAQAVRKADEEVKDYEKTKYETKRELEDY